MITAALIGNDRLVARLAAMPQAVTQGLAGVIARLGRQLQDHVQRDKLGGEVLRARSGKLASSISVTLAQDGPAIAATLATDVAYAAIHEYGGTIPAHAITPQSARVLAFPWKGKPRFFKRVEIPAVTMPERSFLRSALDDMAPEIRAEIDAAVREAIRR